MTKSEIHVLYNDLNKLLSDICVFLTKESGNGKFSGFAEQKAKQLIERSKKQLEAISVLSDDSGRYVDMHANIGEYIEPTEKTCDDFQEIYSSVDEDVIDKPPLNSETETCPYENTPAQEIPKSSKQGFLDRKGKFFFIEHQKKVFACIYDNWMLIYGSEKDQKPTDIFNLKQFKAKEIESLKKPIFELICTQEPAKNYIFTAITKKDVLQWVEAINFKKPTASKQASTVSFFDIINSKQKNMPQKDQKIEEEQEEVYFMLAEDDYNDIVEKPNDALKRPIPVLPPRTPNKELAAKGWDPKLRPVPSIPKKQETEDVYDPVQSVSETSSFSDVDSTVSYDELINLQTEEKPPTKPLPPPPPSNVFPIEDDNQDYDVVLPPNISNLKNNKEIIHEQPSYIEFPEETKKPEIVKPPPKPKVQPKPQPKPKLFKKDIAIRKITNTSALYKK